MAVDMAVVRKLREQTGIGILECKKALEEVGGDFDKAVDLLRKKGYEKAKSKSSRATNQGVINSYIHSNSRIGVLLEVACETDFVAKNEDFMQFTKDVCLQIAAMNPEFISSKDVPEDVINKEKEIIREQLKDSGKPENIIDNIVEGKLKKYYSEVCLLNQTFFKDDQFTIESLLTEKIHKIGENIVIKRFTRYEVGEEF
ncbi:MAG: translation elongation factor Ts [Acidobacteriota bacterium]